MTVTIDRAGRIVVPKSLRERFNLVAGTELEIAAGADCLRLRRVDAEPALVRKKGILVHHGGARMHLDVAAFIRAERDSRSRSLRARPVATERSIPGFTVDPDSPPITPEMVRAANEDS